LNRVYLKKDIIRYLAKDSGYSQAVCEEVLDSFGNLLVEAVENGDRVQLYGIIDVETQFVPEHFRTDPRDNTIRITVKDKYKLKVSVGKRLRDAVKQTMSKVGKPE
jgi:nucleoid DNA-binding protein